MFDVGTEINTPGYIIPLLAVMVAGMQIVKETSFHAKFESVFSI